MPIVGTCLIGACLMIISACFVVCFTTTPANAVPFSIRMVFRTYACLVKKEIIPFTTDGAGSKTSTLGKS